MCCEKEEDWETYQVWAQMKISRIVMIYGPQSCYCCNSFYTGSIASRYLCSDLEFFHKLSGWNVYDNVLGLKKIEKLTIVLFECKDS